MSTIYIIILNWNGWQDTLRCLRSLEQVTTPHNLLLVDNGSTNNSVQEIRQAFPTIDILKTGANLGFAGGNNFGISYALAKGADYILLLNNDTIVEPNFLAPLITAINASDTIAAVNPKIYFLNDLNRIWSVGGQTNLWLAKAGNRGRGEIDQGQYDQIARVDFGTGCCLLIKRQAIEQIGLLNEAYFAYYEDADWSYRANQLGYRILYVPDSKIWHAVGSSSKKSTERSGKQSPFVHYLAARNQLWFLKDYTVGWQRITAYIAYFFQRILFYSVAFLVLNRRNKLVALWRGFGDGVFSAPTGTSHSS